MKTTHVTCMCTAVVSRIEAGVPFAKVANLQTETLVALMSSVLVTADAAVWVVS